MKLKTKKTIRSIISGIIVFVLFSLVAIVFAAAILNLNVALADSAEPNAWVLRRSVDSVLIQKTAGRQPYDYSRFYDNDPLCGSELHLTGNTKGHWMECIVLYLPSQPTGWIYDGFVVRDKPQISGQIATVTQRCSTKLSIGGRTTWDYYPGEQVTIYHTSEKWCTCDWGYIPTEAITFDTDVTTTKISNTARLAKYGYSRDKSKWDHLINIIDGE